MGFDIKDGIGGVQRQFLYLLKGQGGGWELDITGKTISAIGAVAAKAVEVDEKFQILEKTSDAAMATMKKVTYGVGVVAKLAAGK